MTNQNARPGRYARRHQTTRHPIQTRRVNAIGSVPRGLDFTRLFEAALNATLLVDAEDHVVMANQAAVDLSGYSLNELIGFPSGKLIAEGWRAVPLPARQDGFARRKNGETLPVEITRSQIHQAGKTYELWMMRDITPRKQIESELDEMKNRLLDSTDIERARLAQQLHDGPLQDLYGAFYQIQEIQSLLDGTGQEMALRALQTIQGVNATLRVICGELLPNTLVHLGLQRAIRGHAERLGERLDGVTIHLELEDDSPGGASLLSHHQRLGLFRVYQQLISNAVRHSESTDIWVRLKMEQERVTLEVQDHGKGFRPPERWVALLREGKYGLVQTSERVKNLNGQMEILSNLQEGTLARVSVPRE